MRHRHYNWDILLATPDIKEIAGFIRSVCEVAYCHSSKDAIPIPYYKRRPRILEHLPKSNGTTVGKNDIVSFKKVPLDVFKLYKSTATGNTTKSGAGQSPFTFKLVAGFAFILLYILYMVFFFFDDDSDKVSVQANKSKATQIQSNKTIDQKFKKSIKKGGGDGVKDMPSIDDVSFRDANVSAIITGNNFVNLPYAASAIYINGITTVTHGNHQVSRDYVFTLYVHDKPFSVSSDSLLDMGYKVFYKKPCLVELRSDIGSNYVYCELDELKDDSVDSGAVTEVSLLN
jgi:zona occludens toxin